MKYRTLVRHSIDVGRLHECIASTSQVIPAKVIDQNEYNVGLLRRVSGVNSRRCRDQQQSDAEPSDSRGRKDLSSDVDHHGKFSNAVAVLRVTHRKVAFRSWPGVWPVAPRIMTVKY